MNAVRLDIDRVHARYELSDVRLADRLDRALVELSDAIDDALCDIDAPHAFAVCIESLAVDVHVDPTTSVSDIARVWAAAVVASLRDHLHGSSMLVYPRRVDLLVDVVRSVASSDLSHRWAWRQVGLVGIGSVDRPDVGRLLAAWPAEALHVIRLEPGCLGLLAPEQVIALADAVAGLVGVAEADTSAAPLTGTPGARARRPWMIPADRLAAIRLLLGALDRSGAWSNGDRATRQTLLTLALAVVEPSRCRDRALVAALLAELDDPPVASAIGLAATDAPSSQAPGAAPGPDVPHAREVGEDGRPPPTSDGRVHDHPAIPTVQQTGRRDTGPTDAPIGDSVGFDGHPTAVGGLWFIAHAVDELDLLGELVRLLDEIRTDDAWTPTELLAAAAHALCGAADHDVGARLLFGLESDAPILDIESATRGGQIVRDLADLMDAWVRRRLDVGSDESIDWVWNRSATVVADPGWIEVTFLLDDVDVRLRRAGLDLDPGFLWWRGAVVRFRHV